MKNLRITPRYNHSGQPFKHTGAVYLATAQQAQTIWASWIESLARLVTIAQRLEQGHGPNLPTT